MVDSKNQVISFSDDRHLAQPHFIFNTVLSAAGLLSCVLAVVLVGGVVMLRLAPLLTDATIYADPFITYAAILPGQWAAALDVFACQSIETRMNGRLLAGRSSCAIFPEDGFFDLVHVESRDSRITEVTFYATQMQVGDMILHRGRYSIKQIPNAIKQFSWEADTYTIEIVATPSHYQDRVRLVIFTVKPQL